MLTVFVNDRNEIKDVNVTEDENLTPIEIDEEVFKDWSVAKICCYKLILRKGKFAGFTPYIDTRIIDHIDRLSQKATESDTRVASLEEAVDILVLESLGL